MVLDRMGINILTMEKDGVPIQLVPAVSITVFPGYLLDTPGRRGAHDEWDFEVASSTGGCEFGFIAEDALHTDGCDEYRT